MIGLLVATFAAAVTAFGFGCHRLLRQKNIDIWIGSYARQALRKKPAPAITDAYFCFVDHFEPYGGQATKETAHRRTKNWCTQYPLMAEKHRDSAGRHPQHTYFYPEEEYDPEVLDWLSALCRRGFGDVEIHLHHDNDTADALREKLMRFKRVLHERHGLLKKNPKTGEIEYGFIHGNWALDNSRKDGRWCGVNDELSVFKTTGCYADFTLPSAPSDTQTKKINSLYFAKTGSRKPKSHNEGRDVRAGYWDEEALPIFQGPLALNWKNRKWGFFPRIENSEISYDNLPARHRVKLWAGQRIQVEGRPDSIFIKVHTHGAQDKNQKTLFDEKYFDSLYGNLESELCPDNGYRLHYVTAREMYEKVRHLSVGQAQAPDGKPS